METEWAIKQPPYLICLGNVQLYIVDRTRQASNWPPPLLLSSNTNQKRNQIELTTVIHQSNSHILLTYLRSRLLSEDGVEK